MSVDRLTIDLKTELRVSPNDDAILEIRRKDGHRLSAWITLGSARSTLTSMRRDLWIRSLRDSVWPFLLLNAVTFLLFLLSPPVSQFFGSVIVASIGLLVVLVSLSVLLGHDRPVIHYRDAAVVWPEIYERATPLSSEDRARIIAIEGRFDRISMVDSIIADRA